MNNFDSYASDQFIYRDVFRGLKARIDLKVKGNYHNLYINNGHFVEIEYPLNINSVDNLIKKVNDIKDMYLKDNNIYFSIIPDKNYFVDDGNLKIDYKYLEKYIISNLDIKYINIFDTLHLDDYYKTDSHFMISNVKDAAVCLLNEMDNNYYEDVSVKYVDLFDGVYKSRLPISISSDKLNIITNRYIDNAKVFDYLENDYIDFYDLSKLKSNDKYEMFLGGSSPLIKIYNDESLSDREIIIFRDSFASSLTPLLVSSYKSITLVDTRYIQPSLIKDYIDFNNKDILFIYNVSLINNSFILK